ncbi:LacI family DNA-binding transcriptional regulator [Raineyella fluvialis]|uniref:LacI family DNA-binding transcriptional regulator n=1 Tax=Raineyella fluvialis TaxID=2662261 RepID=A0A5Q2FEL9_9ACTN|nr:LacI family DNA-binding transcriptional regulator [Raineyella fluvialis]QGF23924.1 LacI family DNA-binding transcriptional regulator [Raineyella fluvialis]
MPRTVTIRDVAAKAGVSPATASRVLTGSDQTSERARSAVRKAAADMGYSPNGVARSLRMSRTGVVGLLVSDIRNPHFAYLAHTIQTRLASSGYAMILGNASEDESTQDLFLQHVTQQRVDGLILAPQNPQSAALRTLVAAQLPLVFVDRIADGFDIPYAVSDSAMGLGAAFAHLAGLGHTRCGLVAGPLGTSTGRERHDYFASAAPQYFSEGVRIERGADAAGPREAFRRLVEDGCTAVVFAYGPHTMECLDLWSGPDFRAPGDISVASFDDFPVFRVVSPALTAIRQDVDGMGEAVVDLLVALLSGQELSHPHVTLPTSLIVRDSTGRPNRRTRP